MSTTITAPKPVRKSPHKPLDRQPAEKPGGDATKNALPPVSRHGLETPPAAIANDPQALELWQKSTEDERFLAEELCALNSRTHATGIECYFRFSDAWFERYPREDRNNYKRGLQAVKNGAAMSHTAPSQVYFILKTIKVYQRKKYQELAVKAAKNGLDITWTHLRTLAERLGKSELRKVRVKVERILVSQKMTEKQLNALIDEMAPETVSKRNEKEKNDTPGKAQISAIITSFKKNAPRYKQWLTAISKFEDEFQGDDPKEVQTVLEQVRTALEEFQRMAEFIDEGRPLLETLEQQVSFLAEHDHQASAQTNERIARSVRERVASEKNETLHRQQRKSGRLKLAGDFAEDDEDDRILEPVLRDNDRFVPSAGTAAAGTVAAGTAPDDEPVMEDEEYEEDMEEDEEDFDMEEEEEDDDDDEEEEEENDDDEWDDLDELDEDEDEIFDETDDLLDED